MTGLLLLALMLLLSRPLLAAARPPGTILLAAGALLSWAAPGARSFAPVVIGLCGAWLALAAAEPFAAGILAPSAGGRWLRGLLSLFADPAAFRAALTRSTRPDAAARTAPAAAELGVALGLLATVFAAPPRMILAALVAGGLLGLAASAGMRLLRGREMTLAALAAVALVGHAAAASYAFPAPALLVAAGMVLARDQNRLELTFTLLNEHREVATLGLLGAAGMLLADSGIWSGESAAGWTPWAVAAALPLVRWTYWRRTAALASSPLLLLAGYSGGPFAPDLALPLAAIFIAGEAIERVAGRGGDQER